MPGGQGVVVALEGLVALVHLRDDDPFADTGPEAAHRAVRVEGEHVHGLDGHRLVVVEPLDDGGAGEAVGGGDGDVDAVEGHARAGGGGEQSGGCVHWLPSCRRITATSCSSW